MQFRNLVLSGGSFKASAFIGCYKYIEEHGHVDCIQNIIGSSAGSVIGFMICLGYTWKQMREFVAIEATKFVDQEIDIENIFNIFYTLGVDDGTEAIKVFERAFTFKYPKHEPNITFINLVKLTGKNFIVCGSNISTSSISYFGVDTTPDMEVMIALRISVSIPLIMTPVIYKDNLYVDASLFNNFPIEYFYDKNLPFTDTLALTVSSPPGVQPNLENLNMLAYMKLMLESVFNRVNYKKKKLIASITNVIVEIVIDDDMFDFEKFKLIMDTKSLDRYIEHGYDQIKTKLNHDSAVVDETNA